MSTYVRWGVIAAAAAWALSFGCRGGGGGGGQTVEVGPDGGTVRLGSVTVEIDPGTLTESTVIEIERTTAGPAGNIGAAYDFGPEGVTFDPPVTLRFGYTAATLGATSPADLTIATAVDGVWMPVESVVDTELSEVRASLTHFSVYGLVDRTGGGDGDGDVDSDVDSDVDTDVDSDVDTDADSDSDSDADVECTHDTCEWSSGMCSCEWTCGTAVAWVWCNIFTEPFGCDCDGDEVLDCELTGDEGDPCGDDLCCDPQPH